MHVYCALLLPSNLGGRMARRRVPMLRCAPQCPAAISWLTMNGKSYLFVPQKLVRGSFSFEMSMEWAHACRAAPCSLYWHVMHPDHSGGTWGLAAGGTTITDTLGMQNHPVRCRYGSGRGRCYLAAQLCWRSAGLHELPATAAACWQVPVTHLCELQIPAVCLQQWVQWAPNVPTIHDGSRCGGLFLDELHRWVWRRDCGTAVGHRKLCCWSFSAAGTLLLLRSILPKPCHCSVCLCA